MLGPDLTQVHQRMGTAPLVSAIQNSKFKVMQPIYDARPVTQEEARHLAKYLEEEAAAKKVTGSRAGTLLVIALGSALLLTAGLFFTGVRRRGTRERLLEKMRRSD
jgi:hypothetical protein